MVIGVCVLSGCSALQPASPAAGRPAAASSVTACSYSTPGGHNPNLVFPERLNLGYTLVLPGVGGDSSIDHGIIQGLEDADVRSAVELHNWTSGGWRPVYDLRSLERNRAEAQTIAAKIVIYQEQHPGKPVHVVGYSGGGGVAVLALEALPAEYQVTSTILLGPTLAYDYDLQRALSHTEKGIYNFYSPLDVPVLGALTTTFGTTEGRHTLAAGAVGFQIPGSLDATQRTAYEARLFQQQYQLGMLAEGHAGGHFGWRSRTFVAKYVAPLVEEN
jgi:pimeloyl-ACP methyl ester carboxylesterase